MCRGQRVSAHRHDKVGVAAACGQKSLQNRHAGIVAFADAGLTRQRGAVLVGQFKMRDAAAARSNTPRTSPCRWVCSHTCRHRDAACCRTNANWRRMPSPLTTVRPGRPGMLPRVSIGNEGQDCSDRRSTATTPRPVSGATKTRPDRGPSPAAQAGTTRRSWTFRVIPGERASIDGRHRGPSA